MAALDAGLRTSRLHQMTTVARAARDLRLRTTVLHQPPTVTSTTRDSRLRTSLLHQVFKTRVLEPRGLFSKALGARQRSAQGGLGG